MKCLLCGNEFIEKPSWQKLLLLKAAEVLCEKCRGRFEKAETRDFTSDFVGTKFEGALDSLSSFYKYNEFMIDVLHQYKFLQDVELARAFMEDFGTLKNETSMIVPIPMHLKKLRERTFSQVDELLSCKYSIHTVLEKRYSPKVRNQN
jgi:competence protein ComFC